MERDDMDGLDYWRLCDQLDIIQAAFLVSGHDPSSDQGYVEGWDIEKRPTGYEAAKAAISNALRNGLIEGYVTSLGEYDNNGNLVGWMDNTIDLRESRIEVESLRSWLEGRGFRTGFFFPTETGAPDYLDPNHSRYAPKLAAAVRAWSACDDESTIRATSAKKALRKWLREHASEFGMTDDDGKPNETGIEETAKVANWQPGGGAPKTPNG